jgi:toxin ParE1/3/4
VKPVIIHSKARTELDAAIAYYEQQRAGLGLALQSTVEQATRKIQQNPQIGAPYKGTEFRHYSVRRFPYVIFYAELEEAIWVVAIAHGKRRPEYWRRRKIR